MRVSRSIAAVTALAAVAAGAAFASGPASSAPAKPTAKADWVAVKAPQVVYRAHTNTSGKTT